MKKFKIYIIGISFLILFLIGTRFIFNSKDNPAQNYDWNGGYCAEDGGRLNYIGTGNKVHYQCEECGKKYYFDKIMKYNVEEN